MTAAVAVIAPAEEHSGTASPGICPRYSARPTGPSPRSAWRGMQYRGFGAGDRPERMVTFGPGSILVLFADRLVERRGEIIDRARPDQRGTQDCDSGYPVDALNLR